MNVQKLLFEKLKPLIPADKSLAEYLSNLLYLSSDSVYRRLRGETQMTIDELKTICDHFGLSADALIDIGKTNQVIFEVSTMGDRPLTFEDFFRGIRHELESLKQFPEARIIYTGKDIPFFYNLLFPRLFAFKYHIWMQLFADSPEFTLGG